MTTTTTPQDLTKARLHYAGDWDAEGTTSIYLPTDIAEQLLRERGWAIVTHVKGRGPHRGSTYKSYNAPEGTRYWELDEALRLALTAEVI